MFILTLGTDDKDEIACCLEKLAEQIRKDKHPYGCLGVTINDIDYEYQPLPEQSFATMANWIHWNSDGETLKLARR